METSRADSHSRCQRCTSHVHRWRATEPTSIHIHCFTVHCFTAHCFTAHCFTVHCFTSEFTLQWNNSSTKQQLDSLRWFSQRRSPMPHFWRVHTTRGHDPQIRTQPRFLYNAPTPQVSSSYVYSFGSYHVDKHRNKQTNKHTNKETNRCRWKHPILFVTLWRWVTTKTTYIFNPLKPSFVRRLHVECSVPSRSNLPFLISDIWALWRSGLSARVPECQKLQMVGQAFTAKCNNLRSWALKGFIYSKTTHGVGNRII